MKSSTLGFWLPMGLIVGLLWACNGNNNSKKESNETTPQKAGTLSSADSSLLHFWDQFDMKDTIQVNNPDIGEQKLADFIGLLSATPDSAMRDRAVDLMLDKAKANRPSFDHFIKLYERYLYDGNSPLLRWNKELFSNMNTILEKIIAQVPVGYLKCLPDAAAAALCHAALFPNG